MSSQLQRNLTLTSCLGKLFTSILQNRLNKFIEQHNIFNPEQFGFRPNARTTDSLFILRQLLHKYTKQHKKLYVGFIDYEKAFDSVWQFGMIQKLHKYGIQGKFLNIIKSMYSSIKGTVSQTAHAQVINQKWSDVFKFVICETKWRQQAEDRILTVTEAVETTLAVRRFLIRAAA